jgi:hypothetical protein
MYEPWAAESQQPPAIRPDRFLYFMPPPGAWLRQRGTGGEVIATWEQWRGAGFDTASELLPGSPRFVDAEGGDFRLAVESPAVRAGSGELPGADDPRLRVAQDFAGAARPDPPSCGAFEAAQR